MKPVVVTDLYFTGVVRSVDTKTNKITVAWGGGPESQHDVDELMPMPSFEGASVMASVRRMRADVEDLLTDVQATSGDEPPAQRSVFEETAKISSVSDGMRSRRAMYWCGPERTYRLTQQEQESGVGTCPKCKVEMNKEKFTRSDKLLTCPSCGFKVPTSKAVTQVEVKVPEGVSVQVTQQDSQGQDVSSQEIMAGAGRGRRAAVDPKDLEDLPRLTLGMIASLVYQDWKNGNYAAKPYLEAMSTLNNVSDMYGQDSGTSIVAYFLSNATTWRGEVAKVVKKELQRRIRR